MGRVALIALDINILEAYYDSFSRLPIDQKILLIADRIEAICKDMQIKEPSALWIVTWREYGLDKEAMPTDIKARFKTTLRELTQRYPQLAIVAGTVLSKKRVTSTETKKAKLAALKDYYKQHTWVEDKEVLLNIEAGFSHEKKQIATLEKKGRDFDILRNTCYVFTGDQIFRHDKIAPIDERKDTDSISPKETVFQPGKGRNISPFCELIHPLTQEKISLGVEICREHAVGYLKRVAYQQKPFLHLVLSASVDLYLNKIQGLYTAHLDSIYTPQLILSENKNPKELPIHFYQVSLTNPHYKLSGPLQPIYPLALQMIDKLQTFIPLLASSLAKNHLQLILADLKRDFSKSVCQELANVLDELDTEMKNAKKMGLFTPPIAIFKKIQELRKDITNILNSDENFDLRTKENALPMDKGELLIALLSDDKLHPACLLLLRESDLLENVSLTLPDGEKLLNYIPESNLSALHKQILYQQIIQNMQDRIMLPLKEFNDETLLHHICSNKSETIIPLVKEMMPFCSQNINQVSADKNTALHTAIIHNAHPDVIKLLVAAGANPNLPNKHGDTAIILAECSDYPEELISFLENGAKPPRPPV